MSLMLLVFFECWMILGCLFILRKKGLHAQSQAWQHIRLVDANFQGWNLGTCCILVLPTDECRQMTLVLILVVLNEAS